MDMWLTLTLTSGATVDLTIGEVEEGKTIKDFVFALVKSGDGWIIDAYTGTAIRADAIAVIAPRVF